MLVDSFNTTALLLYFYTFIRLSLNPFCPPAQTDRARRVPPPFTPPSVYHCLNVPSLTSSFFCLNTVGINCYFVLSVFLISYLHLSSFLCWTILEFTEDLVFINADSSSLLFSHTVYYYIRIRESESALFTMSMLHIQEFFSGSGYITYRHISLLHYIH